MRRPRVIRDPVHDQILFRWAELKEPPARDSVDHLTGWLVPKLIRTLPFQRLRHIRQNGLSNLVFPGMEHSRFSHSLGVFWMGDVMLRKVLRNLEESLKPEVHLATVAAALLHDLGHGPFSHTFEEIFGTLRMEGGTGTSFHHESMTLRFILEEGEVNALLRQIDGSFPEQVAAYISKEKREHDHWTYRVVSSQLDADRLDYLLRDARYAGIRGHGFDLSRLLDMLGVDGDHIYVNGHAVEALEAYLLMLDHMYKAVYFHPAIRGSAFGFRSALRRAHDLFRQGDSSVFPLGMGGRPHPLALLFEKGEEIDLSDYVRLGEFQVWTLIEDWQQGTDPILCDLSRRVMRRHRFGALDFDANKEVRHTFGLQGRLAEVISPRLGFASKEEVARYYIDVDDPKRIGYKSYDWTAKDRDESIFLKATDDATPVPIELVKGNPIFQALSSTNYFNRIMFPLEFEQVVSEMLT